MRVEEFKKLDQKINSNDFNTAYKNINNIMFILSIFGHLASIFLAYFLLSNVLKSVNENIFFVFITSIIILGGLELLKRDIFDKFSTQYLKMRRLSKDVLPLFLLSFTIIGISFYASISGAKEYSSKEKAILNESNTRIQVYNDSIDKSFNIKIKEYDIKITNHENKREEAIAKKEQYATSDLKNKDKNRVLNDLSKEIEFRTTEIDNIKLDKDKILKDKEVIKNNFKLSVDKDMGSKKSDNNKNSLMFIIISTLIEVVILAGVYFNEYYKYRSHREYKVKIDKDPNFQKWLLYDEILNVIINEDTKMNQKLPSNKNIIEMCMVNDIIVLPKDMTSFLKTALSLGILKMSGSTRYIVKTKDNAHEILKTHFKIK